MPIAPPSGLSCHIWHASYHWLRASCHLWHASFQLPSVLLELPNRNANCQPKNWQASISSSDESFSTRSSMVRNAAPALSALSSQRRTRCGRGTRRGVSQTPKYLYSITTSNSQLSLEHTVVDGNSVGGGMRDGYCGGCRIVKRTHCINKFTGYQKTSLKSMYATYSLPSGLDSLTCKKPLGN